jgi:hypothetical protein
MQPNSHRDLPDCDVQPRFSAGILNVATSTEVPMKRFATSTLAAVLAASALLATAQPAQAERWRHHRNNDNDEVAAAIVGGIAGLAIGAALAGRSDRDRYDDRYDRYDGYGRYGNGDRYRYRYDPYTDGYYSQSYSRRYRDRGDYGRTCISRDRVYDPYIGRRVTIERRYRC